MGESTADKKSPNAEEVGTPEDWRRLPLYASFFGLREAPFDLTPNPRFLFLTARQREALSQLSYALSVSRGITLILGEAGTGKTTLVRTALTALGDAPVRYVLVNNPTLGRREFYEYLASEFGLSPAAGESKSRFLLELHEQVAERSASGGMTGLIVDEAQSLPYELLEEVRLLGNIETTTTKLLNIILCGQPELAERLNQSTLRQLKQRVALRCELAPLTLQETASYVSGRLRVADGVPTEIFTRDAVIAVHRGSMGIPRTINVICDNALITGFAMQTKPLNSAVIEEVCRDFDLTRNEGATAALVAEHTTDTARAVILPANPDGVEGEERALFSAMTRPTVRRFSFFS